MTTRDELNGRQLLGLAGLTAAQMLGSFGQIIMATLAALVGALLAPAPELATLPVVTGILGVAVAALPAALLIRRLGWRWVFAGALVWSAGGTVLAAVAIASQSFAGLCGACFIMGNNMAVIAQYRFAAAELVPPRFVSRAVSAIMTGTLVAAIAAPWLALKFQYFFTAEFAGSFAILLLPYLLAAAIIAVIPLPDARPAQQSGHPAADLRGLLARPVVQLAIVASAVGYGVMSLVMTATPISMHVVDGHSVDATANVIRAHVLAMYAPSLVSGWLVARLGTDRMLWAGIAMELACIMFAAMGQSVGHYQLALIALGAGWNFLFVAGTTLLTTACDSGERARVSGFNDLLMFATMAVASLAAGSLLHNIGWVATNFVAVTMLLLLIPLLLRKRASHLKF